MILSQAVERFGFAPGSLHGRELGRDKTLAPSSMQIGTL